MLDSVYGELANYKKNLYAQMNLTKGVQAIKKQFATQIDYFEEGVVFKFHKNSTVYSEVFPHGITPYKEANLPETPIMLDLAIGLADKYKSDIGDTYLTELTKIKSAFEEEADAQGLAKVEVKNIIPNYKLKRHAIDVQLLKNICTIILQNLENPKVISSFFDEYLIFPKSKKKDHGKPVVLVLGPKSHVAADLVFEATDVLLVTNTGKIPIFYYFASTPNTPVPSKLNEIVADQELLIKVSDIPAPDNKYIIFVNADTTKDGEVEISIN